MGDTPQSAQNQPEYVEEPAMYLYTTTLAASGTGAHIPNVQVPIDRDADFMLTGLNGSSTGDFTLNFQLPSQRLIANAEINASDLLGTANQPTAIGPPPIYRAGSSGPILTLTNTSGSSNTINIIFSGIRRLRTS